MANLPKRFTPVMGSLNEELLTYASEKGVALPDPNEVMEIVVADGERAKKTMADDSSIIETVQPEDIEPQNEAVPQIQYGFCRKCGAQLMADSGFCHKCGTQIAKQ